MLFTYCKFPRTVGSDRPFSYLEERRSGEDISLWPRRREFDSRSEHFDFFLGNRNSFHFNLRLRSDSVPAVVSLLLSVVMKRNKFIYKGSNDDHLLIKGLLEALASCEVVVVE